MNVKNYTFTTNESLNGIGRFFMHTTSQVLDIDDTLLAENISIYKTNLRIVGIQNGTADLVLFDIL